MPSTLSQLYIHHVSSVKCRHNLIHPIFETQLHKYIIGVIKNLNQTPIQVNGMSDHIHIAARLRPDMPPSVFVQKVKANSSRWINEQGFLNQKFRWQKGGATFSVSQTHVDALIYYIKNQKRHHRKTSFRKEYLRLFELNQILANREDLPEFFDELYAG